MRPPSDHLLRTLAAVAPGTRVVDAACGEGRHLDALARLGFDVWACTAGDPAPARAVLAGVLGDEAARRVTRAAPDALGYPDDWADWGVLAGLDMAETAAGLAEIARVLAPGAWVWVETDRPDGLVEAAAGAGLLLAEAPSEVGGATRAIFRKPGGAA